MADNLPKRQIPGDAKWLSAAARLARREGHGNISDELNFKDVIDKAIRDALEQIKWGMSQLQRGCTNKIIGLRADCWAPEPRETFGGLSQPAKVENDELELLKPNRTYYVRTNKPTAITLWLPDATKSDGEPVEVKDADGLASARNITIKTLRGQTIDGASTFTITGSYGSAMFRSNGQQWYTVARENTADASGDVIASGVLTANRLVMGQGTTVVAVTAITRDASENLTGIGTIASGAHTVTVAAVGTTTIAQGQDATTGPWEKVIPFELTTDGTAGLQTIIDIAEIASSSVTITYDVQVIRSDAGRHDCAAGWASFSHDGATLALLADTQPHNTGEGHGNVAWVVSGTNMRLQITPGGANVYRVRGFARVSHCTSGA